MQYRGMTLKKSKEEVLYLFTEVLSKDNSPLPPPPKKQTHSNSKSRNIFDFPLFLSYIIQIFFQSKRTLSQGQKRARVTESWYESSNTRLALNSLALLATLAVSHPLLSNLILLKSLLKVAKSFFRLSCHVMNSRQLSFLFGRADDSHRELEKTLLQVSMKMMWTAKKHMK